MARGYAVVDVETTGLNPGWHHRVVEVAVVQLDRTGSVVGEWCTLVNPERDLGPGHIHGIRAAEVRQAPTFAEIAGDLAMRLAGHVIVAHNLSFDTMFLAAEYARLGAEVPLAAAPGLCTMRLSDQFLMSAARSLAACCVAAGIHHEQAHSALHDAHAAAGLLACFLSRTGRPEPWWDLLEQAGRWRWPMLPSSSRRLVQRGQDTQQPVHFLARPWGKFRLAAGDLVVFTGQTQEPREVWEERALVAGLAVNSRNVTKKTRVVIAADPDSLSGKAAKARAYGIPIVTEEAFSDLLDQMRQEQP